MIYIIQNIYVNYIIHIGDNNGFKKKMKEEKVAKLNFVKMIP